MRDGDDDAKNCSLQKRENAHKKLLHAIFPFLRTLIEHHRTHSRTGQKFIDPAMPPAVRWFECKCTGERVEWSTSTELGGGKGMRMMKISSQTGKTAHLCPD
jgi:hypothetical protein